MRTSENGFDPQLVPAPIAGQGALAIHGRTA
jgi:hypothetical protein